MAEESPRPPNPSLVRLKPVFNSLSEESPDSSKLGNTPSVSVPELRSISPPFLNTSPLRYFTIPAFSISNLVASELVLLIVRLQIESCVDLDRCWSLLETQQGIIRRHV